MPRMSTLIAKSAAALGIASSAATIWLSVPLAEQALHKCPNTDTYDIPWTNAKTGKTETLGPFKAADLGCPKKGESISFPLLVDGDGHPLDKDGKLLRPGGIPFGLDPSTLPTPTEIIPINGQTTYVFGSSSNKWALTNTMRWSIIVAGLLIAIASFYGTYRLRRRGAAP